jgi:hypothetical protein
MKTKLHYFYIMLALLAGIHQAAAQGTTAFTYQGQLRDGGTNANGAYTMMFALYDAASSSNQIGSTITTSPTLANGLFSVNLDFGSGAFTGSARWLDITITNGGTTQTLSPRVQVLPAPYALFSAVAATVTNGAIMNAQLAGNAVNTTNIQNGAITTAQIANGAVANANLTANAVATANLQDGAVTDAKISSVSGSKISGTVASAANLANGTWSTSVGSFQSPNGGPLVNNALIFSVAGTPQMEIGPNGAGVGVLGELHATGSISTGGSIRISNHDAGDSVNTIAGDGQGNLNFDSGIVAQHDLTVVNQITCLSLVTTSDRSMKENFMPTDNQEILERVTSLPISRWNFKTDGKTRHIGPMAQDFYAAFNVGMDDKHIATVDEDGVALAAIQGLNQKLEEQLKLKDDKISALEKRLADLEKLVNPSE